MRFGCHFTSYAVSEPGLLIRNVSAALDLFGILGQVRGFEERVTRLTARCPGRMVLSSLSRAVLPGLVHQP